MTTYKYKGVSPDGARVSGVIKAYDEFEAVSQLRETCSVVTKIEAVPEQKEGGVSFGSHRIKDKELAILCSQFAIILTSGLPIDRCVEMVAAQARSREIQQLVMDKSVTDFYRFTRDSFSLEGYDPQPFDDKIPVAI